MQMGQVRSSQHRCVVRRDEAPGALTITSVKLVLDLRCTPFVVLDLKPLPGPLAERIAQRGFGALKVVRREPKS